MNPRSWWMVCGLLAALALPVRAAESPAALAAKAKSLAQRVDAAGGDEAAEQKLLSELGALSVAYLAAADAAQLGGGRDKAPLRTAFEAIHAPLTKLYDRHLASSEGAVDEIIAADGDLEALYESPAYQRSQAMAANALYYLNWLRYYGARTFDGAPKKKLLEQARDGFAELALAESAELALESRLGRGLAELDLSEWKAAIADLQAVADAPEASGERRHKARLALLDASARAGNTRAVLDLSDELLRQERPQEGDWIRFMRLQALLRAAEKGGPDAAKQRAEAIVLMDRLRRAGPAWQEQVDALAQKAFADAAAWKAQATTPYAKWELAKAFVQKQDYAGAAPLLTDVVAAKDPGLDAVRGEASYLLGLARFKLSDFAGAAAILGEPAGESASADRAYLLFKAREAVAAAAGAEADLAPLEAAARAFADTYPDNPHAVEARFRVAEIEHARGDVAAAIDSYAKVKGDAELETQAAFASLQCRFELLQTAESVEARQTQLTAIGADLQTYDKHVAALAAAQAEKIALPAMQAKVAILRAVYHKLQPQSDPAAIVAALDGFEDRHPDEKELLPQVVKLRLEAMLDGGDFAGALAQVQRHGAVLLETLGAGGVEDLAVSFVRAGARRSGDGDKLANAPAQQVALALYDLVGGAPGSSTQLTRARLRENSGDLDAAEALYREAAGVERSAPSALRGLARIAEKRGQIDAAIADWQRLMGLVRPGDLPWYESRYEVARLLDAKGDAATACTQLTELRPAMPGLQDDDLRQKLSQLYEKVCG